MIPPKIFSEIPVRNGTGVKPDPPFHKHPSGSPFESGKNKKCNGVCHGDFKEREAETVLEHRAEFE
jgi:hypothetical protein